MSNRQYRIPKFIIHHSIFNIHFLLLYTKPVLPAPRRGGVHPVCAGLRFSPRPSDGQGSHRDSQSSVATLRSIASTTLRSSASTTLRSSASTTLRSRASTTLRSRASTTLRSTRLRSTSWLALIIPIYWDTVNPGVPGEFRQEILLCEARGYVARDRPRVWL